MSKGNGQKRKRAGFWWRFTRNRSAVVGLIGAAAIILMFKVNWIDTKPVISVVRENFTDWISWGLFAAATVASLRFKIGPIPIILAGGALGLLIY